MNENISQDECMSEIKIINNIVLTVPENKKLFNRICLVIIALIGLTGTIGSFFTMFKTDVNVSTIAYYSAAFFIVFTVIFMLPRKFHYIFIAFAALWGFLLYKMFYEFENGFKMLFNQIYKNIYPNSSDYHTITDKETEHVEIFLVFTIFIIIFFICTSVYSEPSLFFGFLFTFSVLETGLYFGKSPNLIYAFMLIIFWVALAALRFCGHYQKNSQKASGFVRHNNVFNAKPGIRFNTAGMSLTVIAVICCVIFALTALFSSLTGYKRSEYVNTIRSDMKIAANEFSFDNLGESLERFSASLGFDKLKVYSHKLGNIGSINFKHQKELTVETDGAIDSNVYLKGYTGTVYSDNEWIDFPDSIYDDNKEMFDEFYNNETFPQDMLTNYFFNRYDLYYVNMDITAEYDAEKYNYIPYISVPDGNITYTGDTLTSLENKKKYSFDVNKLQITKSNFTDVLSGLDYSINDSFDEYTEFVYDNYCSYEQSEGLEEVYKRFVKGTVLETDADIYQKLIYIKELLQKNASYTLNPGRTPGNEDFVNYFLLDNHKGFCVHYATAGVILARMAGIPARYCDGFVVHGEDFNGKNRQKDGSYKIELDDSRGHAWGEIYIENLGWIPYEFTGAGPAVGEEETTEPAQTTITKKQTTKLSVSKSKSVSSKNSVPDTEKNSITVSSDNVTVKKSEIKLPFSVKVTIMFILFIAVVTAVIALRHIIAVRNKKISISQSDKVKSVTCAYNYLLDILDFCDINKGNMQYLEFTEYAQKMLPDIIDSRFEEVTGIMLKAQLSEETISEEEVNKVSDYYRHIYTDVYNKSGIIRKINMKFIKNL